VINPAKSKADFFSKGIHLAMAFYYLTRDSKKEQKHIIRFCITIGLVPFFANK
jgi:hypothetical protein